MMVRTTREQRVALKRVFDRGPIYVQPPEHATPSPITYRAFRERVQPTFGCDGCIMIHWAGMWLGIEPDGYTHS